MSGTRWDAVVVGGGANGLTAATTLGRAGRRVLLLERAATLGGRGRAVEFAPGFRAAPLALDPGWIPPPVARALGLAGLEPAPADPPLSVAIGPGAFLTLPADPRAAARAIAPHSARDAGRWPSFVAGLGALAGFLARLYRRAAPDLAARSPAEALAMLDLALAFRFLGRERMVEFLRTLPLSVAELLDDTFECAPLKAAVATVGVRDHAQGPRSGGTAFVLLHHLVGARPGALAGRPARRGGAATFSAAAEAAARRAGVTVRTSAAVTAIEVRDDGVEAVVLEDGERIACRAALSTADPRRTLRDWVDPAWLDPEFLHALGDVRYRGCTAFVLLALDAAPEFPGLDATAAAGLVSLTPSLLDLERAADARKYGRVSERPHVECAVPSLADPSLAPPGRHVLVARVACAPYRLRDGAAWDAERRDALAGAALEALERVSPGLRSRILHRAVWAPPDLEERFGLPEGAPSCGELGLDQILFMRPVPGWSRYETPIRGLLLGGAGSHPGPGVLGGPGWLAARRLLRRPAENTA